MQENLLVVKKVKVRIKIGTNPYLGYVDVPAPIERVSDILNSRHLFLPLTDVSSLEPVTPGAHLIINKGEISYIQTLEERSNKSRATVDINTIGQFKLVKIVLRDSNIRISGEIFVPYKDTEVPVTVNKASFFINLKNVKIEGTREEYSYLAVSRTFIRTLESDGKLVVQS